MEWLLKILTNSRAIIKNKTLLENNVSRKVYDIQDSSIIQLNHVAFTRNKLMDQFLCINSNSSAIIQNNTLLENNVSRKVNDIMDSSTIQFNHVAFTRNKLMHRFLFISSNSNAIIHNSTLLENKFSYTGSVIHIQISSTIQFVNVAFIRNALLSNLLYIIWSSAKLTNNRIIGNSLDQMFHVFLSSLEIDTIFIKNNTFSQLIRVLECNVSFDSMKIRENNVTNDMINVEHSAGRMANTFIENTDNFLTSAFTNTWTYSGNRYFPFEITNTEIIWKHELSVSAQPIIQLSGNVSLSNIKLLVTSPFVAEILRYSTEDIKRLRENGFVRSLPNIYIISSLFITCAKASVKYIKRADSFRCMPCAWGTYTLNNESLNINTSLNFKNINKSEKTNFNCLNCPVGANCTASIKSKSNFYGYKTKEQELKF